MNISQDKKKENCQNVISHCISNKIRMTPRVEEVLDVHANIFTLTTKWDIFMPQSLNTTLVEEMELFLRSTSIFICKTTISKKKFDFLVSTFNTDLHKAYIFVEENNYFQLYAKLKYYKPT